MSLLNSIIWNIRKLFERIQRVVQYIPVIWKSEEWDQDYLFDLMIFKIKRMTKYHQKRKRYVGWERTVDRMNLFCKLLKRVKEDYYELEKYDYCKQKFEFNKVPDTDYSTLDVITISENYADYFKIYSRKYKLLKNKFPTYSDEELARELGYLNEKIAKDLVWKILKENVAGWWD